MPFRSLVSLLLLLAGAGAGCASAGADLEPPVPLAPVRVEQWTVEGEAGRKVTTPHYVIYTTMDDLELVELVGQLMEGALAQYRKLAPGVPVSDRPMECYLFQSRTQWAAFTKSRTGADAAIYLQINRGGYTVGDWYVAYFIGDVGTLAVAAHEGWHQYVARHFVSRLPPFLEEGLACMFEEVRWGGTGEPGRRGSRPRWSIARNTSRLNGLRNVLDSGRLIPLKDLAQMHAGQIVNGPSDRIEAFYAQSWGFAKFLWEAENGRYRPALNQILTDAAEGTLFPGNNSRREDDRTWDPDAVHSVLEYYLGADLPAVEAAYQKYLRRLASRDYRPAPES